MIVGTRMCIMFIKYLLFEKNWYALDIPRHLFNYSDKILTNKLKKEGFKIIKTRYNARPSQFVNSVYYALKIKRRNKLINLILTIIFLPLTWIVNALKWGDQIEIWCEKK